MGCNEFGGAVCFDFVSRVRARRFAGRLVGSLLGIRGGSFLLVVRVVGGGWRLLWRRFFERVVSNRQPPPTTRTTNKNEPPLIPKSEPTNRPANLLALTRETKSKHTAPPNSLHPMNPPPPLTRQ
jgi:hypothetical protein